MTPRITRPKWLDNIDIAQTIRRGTNKNGKELREREKTKIVKGLESEKDQAKSLIRNKMVG